MGDERENELEERGGRSADHLPAQARVACCSVGMVQRWHVATSACCNVGGATSACCKCGMLQSWLLQCCPSSQLGGQEERPIDYRRTQRGKGSDQIRRVGDASLRPGVRFGALHVVESFGLCLEARTNACAHNRSRTRTRDNALTNACTHERSHNCAAAHAKKRTQTLTGEEIGRVCASHLSDGQGHVGGSDVVWRRAIRSSPVASRY